MKRLSLACLLALLIFSPLLLLHAEKAFGRNYTFLRIGTASVGGEFFPMGALLATLIDKSVPKVRATAQPSNGSIHNLRAIEEGNQELGLSQAASVATAMRLNEIPHVRTILHYYATPVHFIVRNDANINCIADLKGRKLEMLTQGSGVEVVSQKILRVFDIPWNEIGRAHV